MNRTIISGCFFIFFIVYTVGCLEKKEPFTVSTHPEGWTTANSPDFHGNAILTKSLSLESCQSCHGQDYLGGSSKVSCYDAGCHVLFPHPQGFANQESENFHGDFIGETLNWDILSCRSCHGEDYAGNGFRQKNCLTCHTKTGGPEYCSTCHGNEQNAAPPVDLAKNTATTVRGVGAHQAHLLGDTWSTFPEINCGSCHKVPANYSDEGHIDDSPNAEVIFNSLATAGGTLNTTWTGGLEASCSDVYCHGAFELRRDESDYPWAYTDSLITGNNPKLFWKSVGTGQVLCGSCHNLPPKGHVAQTSCAGCHGRVVDENLNIINKFLHINGKVEVF